MNKLVKQKTKLNRPIVEKYNYKKIDEEKTNQMNREIKTNKSAIHRRKSIGKVMLNFLCEYQS